MCDLLDNFEIRGHCVCQLVHLVFCVFLHVTTLKTSELSLAVTKNALLGLSGCLFLDIFLFLNLKSSALAWDIEIQFLLRNDVLHKFSQISALKGHYGLYLVVLTKTFARGCVWDQRN